MAEVNGGYDMEDRGFTPRSTGNANRMDNKSNQEWTQWIKSTITKKECVRYVCADMSSEGGDRRCECGRLEEEHEQSSRNGTASSRGSAGPWNRDTDVERKPTDAYGTISFPKNDTKAKYVRLAEDTEPSLIKELLTKEWNLPLPKLVISVIGGAKTLSLKPEDKRNFNQALIKASKTTRTWILTNGTNCGVTKCVGDAVKEGQALKWINSKPVDSINCIGIPPWGYVDNAESLCVDRKANVVQQVEYDHSKTVERGKPVPLNPNHTQFLLADDGRKKFGADLVLRPKLEKAICEDDVPLVLIVLEGGEDSVNHVVNSLKQDVSVVLCKNTGRAADLLSHIAIEIEKEKKADPDRQFCESDWTKIKDSLEVDNKDMKKLISDLNERDMWREICETFAAADGLITIFEMGTREKDLNLAVMKALLSGRHEDTNTQLSLAISWNRIDVTRNIFDRTGNLQVTERHMTKILLQDKAEFLKLFIQHDAFDIEDDALTEPLLQKLYQDKQIFDYTRQLVINVLGRKRTVRRRDENTNENVDKLRHDIRRVLGFKPDKDTCSMPQKRELWFLELFLWATITDRNTVADFCWQRVAHPSAAALIATKILRIMLYYERALDRIETLENSIKKYEDHATGLIDQCYRTDRKLANDVVEKNHPIWNNKTTIEMAGDGENIVSLRKKPSTTQDFIAHPCCTNKLDNDWYGDLSPTLNPWWFIPLALTLIFIPLYNIVLRERFILHFKEETTTGNTRKPWYSRVYSFLKAPVTKFWMYTISYIAWLLVYTYVLLFTFHTTLRLSQVLLFVWIVSMVLEEIRLIVPETRDISLKKGFGRWIRDNWKKMDLLMLLIACIGFGLKFNDSTYAWARTLYAANAFIFFTRLLRTFAASARLGPKIVMIQRMIIEMLFFLSVYLIFLLSYGIASQALLYPTQEPSFQALRRTFYMPYFQIYGELFLDEIVEGECDSDVPEMCPTPHWLVPIMLGVYLLLGNVLLLNLLIAIFSSVYDDIKKNAIKVWKYEWYFLVGEMKDRPILPPPLIIIEHLYRFCRWPFRYFRKPPCPSKTSSFYDSETDLSIFEQDCVSRYIRRVKEKEVFNKELQNYLKKFHSKIES